MYVLYSLCTTMFTYIARNVVPQSLETGNQREGPMAECMK